MDIRIVKSKTLKETPKYAKEGGAGIDLTADSIIKEDDGQITYGTGISIEIPVGYVGLIFPRSSIRNKPLVMANSVGVIDSGEIQCTFNKLEDTFLSSDIYLIGDRICQIIILPIPYVNLIPVTKLSKTERGVKWPWLY